MPAAARLDTGDDDLRALTSSLVLLSSSDAVFPAEERATAITMAVGINSGPNAKRPSSHGAPVSLLVGEAPHHALVRRFGFAQRVHAVDTAVTSR